MEISTVRTVDNEEVIDKVNQVLYGKFYENVGQLKNKDVKYYGLMKNAVIGFAESRVFLWLDNAKRSIELSFKSCNKITPKGIGEIDCRTNYILGNRGNQFGVKTYSSVEYDQIWPGIKLIYSAKSGLMKYEFHIQPDTDPSIIEVNCEGHDEIIITKTSIVIRIGEQQIIDKNLVILQEDKKIHGEFFPLGSGTFGFKIESYDKSKHIIIDPLLYSTYLGGSSLDSAGQYSDCIAVDDFGNVYVTGYTKSGNFPDVNAYDSTYGGNDDCFIVKLNSTGDSLIYSTFIGGSETDRGTSIAVDSSYNVYVTGYTGSSNFPTVNAYNSTHSGHHDCFVLKLNASGDILLYSTYISGALYDYGRSLFVDNFSCVYVLGVTMSSNFPIKNAFDSTYGGIGSYDCFVVKLNSTGNGLEYSTYLGGTKNDEGYSIVCDSTGAVYIVGITESTDFPTHNAYDDTFNGDRDCFVSKLNASGNELLYSSYFGGNNYDYATSVTIDDDDNVYVVGNTQYTGFPTLNAYDDSPNGYFDCFVFKLNAIGNTLMYSTLFGGSRNDIGRSIIADKNGYVYVTGYTLSTDFPVVNPHDSSHNGGYYDCFVFKLGNTGEEVLYSTYIGGSEEEYAYSLSVDSFGNAYITGYTDSSDFPVSNAYDSVLASVDVFILKLPDMGDTDDDQISDYNETQYGTNRFSNDTDSDGMTDGWEIEYNLNATNDDAELDPDNDNLTNLEEYSHNTHPIDNDTDDDNLTDGEEVKIHLTNPRNEDSDNDSLTDGNEVLIYGTDPNDNDTDDDLIPDGWEIIHGLNATLEDAGDDPDNDNLLNLDEFLIGTDPNNNDTDNDLMPDGWEVEYSLNPLLDDAANDTDSDGLSNFNEYNNQTYPNDNDTDNDEMPDGWEVEYSLNPLDNDSLSDPDSDGLPNIDEYLSFTNPHDNDTDDDDMPDGWEIIHGLDATLANSANDTDNDGLTDLQEYHLSTHPSVFDSDGDGLGDGDEVIIHETDPLDDDSDDDSLNDGDEVLIHGSDPNSADSDNDGLSDYEEVNIYGTNPSDADSDNDGYSDSFEIERGYNPLNPREIIVLPELALFSICIGTFAGVCILFILRKKNNR